MKSFYILFRNTEKIDSFPRPASIGIQSVNSPSYHWHGSKRHDGPIHCIFQFTLSGYGIFRDANGEHIVSEGKGFLCESNEPKTEYFFPKNAETEWQFIYLAFMGSMSHEMVRRTVRRYGRIFSIPKDHPLITKMHSYLDYSELEPAITAPAGAKLVSDIIFTLAESREEKRDDALDNLLIHKAGRILSQHSDSDINVTELAKFAGVSREHLTRVFREHAGQTPLQFMTRRKIIAACRLLHEGKASIKEVSINLGYRDHTHFTRTFRRIVGKTPRDFREYGTIPIFD